MPKIIVNSDASLQKFFGAVREDYAKYRYLRFTWKNGKDRSLSFNDLSHCWYEQLALELPDDDAIGWKCYCKLHHGVQIMRVEDAEFRSFYDAAILHSLSYEKKLEAMKYLPVTSIMTNPQFKRYCEAVQKDFAGKGVLLEFPPEDEKKK